MHFAVIMVLMETVNMHDEIMKKMTPEQKLKAAENLYWSARRLKAAWLRHIHPDWSEDEVQQEVKRIFIEAGREEI